MTQPAVPASRWLDRTHPGDCRRLLRQMVRDGVRVRMCVTSPPYYRLRTYLPANHPDKSLELGTEESPAAFVAHLVDVFRLVRNLLTDDGTLWLNIGDSYSSRPGQRKATDKAGPKQRSLRESTATPSRSIPGLKPKDLIGIPWMLAFALRDDGWYLRQDIIWAKPNPMPESTTDRCTRSHEYLFLLAKQERYHFNHTAIMEPSVSLRGPGNIRPVRLPPGQHGYGTNGHLRGALHKAGARQTRHKRDVWTIVKKPFRGAHYAVFPEELVTPCILAGSREDDTVLDPFMGSGTTATVAKRLHRRFIGCELNPSFLDLQSLC